MSIKPEYLAPYGEDLKLTEDGSLDIEYYRVKAEALRAEYLKGLFVSLLSKLKKCIPSVDLRGMYHTPRANIVSSQKLTLSI